MAKIAACVPTLNHAEVVDDVLQKCIEYYDRRGIDIYYYDSSDGGETKEIIDKYIGEGYHNLYYIRVAPGTGIEDKINIILSGQGLQGYYDYIWPIKDRAFVDRESLDGILAAMEEREYDIVFLGTCGQNQNVVYDKPQEFYRDWGWLATSMDATIYRYDTMIAGFDAARFEQEIKDTYRENWCLYAFLFRKLAEADRSIIVLRNERIMIQCSDLGESMWIRNTFKVWKDCWIAANDDLPEIYAPYRDLIIKCAPSLPWIIGDTQRLMELHEMGVLTEEALPQILQDWERVSDIPRNTVTKIARGTYDCYHDVSDLGSSEDKAVELIARLAEMMQEEKIGKQQVPIEDIISMTLLKLGESTRLSKKQLFLLQGSVLDVMHYLEGDDASVKQMSAALQILIDFLLLLQ